MIAKRNVAIVAIMAIALTLGAAGLVTSIGQVAHAVSKSEYAIILRGINGLITSPLPPGFIIQK